jgi:hypothetical protein
MGLLPDPHGGRGPTRPQEEPRNADKRVMGDQSGSALLMGLPLRSRWVSRLCPVTMVGSGPASPLLEMMSVVRRTNDVQDVGNVAPPRLAPEM